MPRKTVAPSKAIETRQQRPSPGLEVPTDRVTHPSPPDEAFVHSIADALKPWNCPEVEVLAKVSKAIDHVRKDRTGQWGLFDVGTRHGNKKYAQKLLVFLDELIKQLAAAPPGFLLSLEAQEVDACVASFLEEGENNGYDGAVDSFLACFDDHQDKPRRELTELSEKLVELTEQCKRSILDPSGPHPKSAVEKIRTAFTAVFLVVGTSKKPPAAGDRNTPLCVIASQLFEAATGEHDPNLERACKYALRTARASRFIEVFSERRR
jgi:hypothetical protein